MALPHVYQKAIELGPEMELRVMQANGSVERQQVREHLTIGRSAASDLVIDTAGVNPIHARVVPGIGGQWELKCVGGSRLMLEDFSSVDRVMLAPGVSFCIGEKKIECVRVNGPKRPGEESDREDSDASTNAAADETQPSLADQSVAGASAGAVNIEMPRLIICPACFKDMSAVPVAARFCPKCGAQLPARNAAGFLIPPEESSPLYPVYRSLRDELEEKLASEAPQVASSMIILAYANAMLNLGWKYEHGRGLLKNVEEAARCYAKAGKLSEAWGK
jgi:hypothetical protein